MYFFLFYILYGIFTPKQLPIPNFLIEFSSSFCSRKYRTKLHFICKTVCSTRTLIRLHTPTLTNMWLPGWRPDYLTTWPTAMLRHQCSGSPAPWCSDPLRCGRLRSSNLALCHWCHAIYYDMLCLCVCSPINDACWHAH